MGYHMRCVVDDDKEISVNWIEATLKRVDPHYGFPAKDAEKETQSLCWGQDWGDFHHSRWILWYPYPFRAVVDTVSSTGL